MSKPRSYIRCSFLALLLSLLLVMSGLPSAFAVESLNSQGPILVVTGVGQVNVKPDQAKITLAVVSSGKTLGKLQEENSLTVTQVIDALLEEGLKRDQIETTRFNAWPQYVYSSGEERLPPEIVGYQVRNEITVTLNNLQNIGQIIEVALKAGANEVQNIAYSLQNDSLVQARALTKACSNANIKASAIAQALGIKIGTVVSVKEGITPSETYPIHVSTAAGRDIPIQPGNITARSTVTITYLIQR